MKTLPKILESSKKIRFQDCDPFNHLNNGKYVDYYINSREDQLLENYDIDLFKIIQEQSIGWVVSNNQVAFLKPVHTMENIVFESQLISFTLRDIQVEMRMWNSEKTILKSIAWFRFVPFHLKKNQVSKHSQKYMELFEKVVLPVSENTFEKRELFFRKSKS